jgi:hypothetical protein
MNADDHARAKTLAADLQEVQQILQRWAHQSQALADENEQLRAENVRLTPKPAPKLGGPTYLTPKQLGERWEMHPGSILRKIRKQELPCVRISNRIRIAMADILAHEAQNHFEARN